MIRKIDRVFKHWDALLKSRRKQLSFLAFAVLIMAIFLRVIGSPKETLKAESGPIALETYIPRGYTLVPIEISNLQQLQSMISDRAVVDLFTATSEAPVAEAVRLVRSPLDPSVFGVLIEDAKTKPLLRHGHEFIVVIKNRSSQPQIKKKRKKRSIYYEEAS